MKIKVYVNFEAKIKFMNIFPFWPLFSPVKDIEIYIEKYKKMTP